MFLGLLDLLLFSPPRLDCGFRMWKGRPTGRPFFSFTFCRACGPLSDDLLRRPYFLDVAVDDLGESRALCLCSVVACDLCVKRVDYDFSVFLGEVHGGLLCRTYLSTVMV